MPVSACRNVIRWLMMMTCVFGVLPACALELDERDAARMERFDATRASALTEALGTQDVDARTTLETILTGTPLYAVDADDLTGQWRCRTIKLGGLSQLLIYSYFSCTITAQGDTYRFSKATGSQRTSGTIFRHDNGAWLYRGAFHYGYEEPMAYDDNRERNEVARVLILHDGRIRLEFPEPAFESRFDILELVR